MTPLNNHNNKIICSGLSLRGHFPCAGASRQCEQLPYAHALLCTRHVTSVCVGHNVTCVKQSLALIGRKYVIEIPEWSFTPCNIGDGLPARSEPWSIPDPALVIFQQRCHKIKLSGLRMPCLKTTSFSYIFLNLRYTTRVLYAFFLRGEVFRVEKKYPGYAYRSMQSMQGGKWRWGASWGSKVDGLLSPCELLLVQLEILRSVLTRLESSRKSFRLLLSVRSAWTLRSFSRNHPKSFRLPIRKTADSEN